MRSADHAVIAEESGDFPDRVIEGVACLDRHAVGADLKCKSDRADNDIRPDQRAFTAQMQIGRQGRCVGDGRRIGNCRGKGQCLCWCDGRRQRNGWRQCRGRGRDDHRIDGLFPVAVQEKGKASHQEAEKQKAPAFGNHLLAFLKKGDAASLADGPDRGDQGDHCHKR